MRRLALGRAKEGLWVFEQASSYKTLQLLTPPSSGQCSQGKTGGVRGWRLARVGTTPCVCSIHKSKTISKRRKKKNETCFVYKVSLLWLLCYSSEKLK